MDFGPHVRLTRRATPRPPTLLPLLLLPLVLFPALDPSASAWAQRRPAPRLFGETQVYEWAKLESFARYLRRRPRERGHVLVYTPRVRTYSAPGAEERLKELKETLFDQFGIEPGRVTLVDGGLREEATVELWVLPRGASPPEPKPTAPREALTICPHVSIGGETFMLRLRQPLTFGVSLYESDPAVRPTFRWTVSHGRILTGQGEQRITVGELEGGAKLVTAEVEVLGLPAGCESRRRMTTGVGVVPYKFDEYGNIRIGDEKARLDNFSVRLESEPELVAYVVAYGGRRGRRGEARNRAERAADYLTSVRVTEPGRVRVVDGGLRESLAVELWLSTRGGPAPVPAPAVAPKSAPRTPRKGRRR
jgi:hypothetical protein